MSHDEWVDVSHGIGVPFGGIGTGYCVFGRYGFVNVNFDSVPDREQSMSYPRGELWRYDRIPDEEQDFALMMSENGRHLLLQDKCPQWLKDAECAENVKAHALMPMGYFTFEAPGWDVDIAVSAFSPLIPHNLDDSSVPVVIFDITLVNRTAASRTLELSFVHRKSPIKSGGISIVRSETGDVGFSCDSNDSSNATPANSAATISLDAGGTGSARFYLAWHFPKFKALSEGMPDTYTRYYASGFNGVEDVLAFTAKNADAWKDAIEQWHDSYDVPAYFKRLWFSSLASVITSTMLSDDPWFFEIETPHTCVNTMDVCVYSSWIYLINWPELERMDICQYLKAMPVDGPDKGFVWHSLWNEGADYMEEPIFPGRLYRDLLWLNDRPLLPEAYDKCLTALERAYAKDNANYLIVSKRGNQSYDGWMMPGVSAFVNSAWLYSLYAVEAMGRALSRTASIAELTAGELRKKASASYDKLLWNEKNGCWNCFYRTQGASSSGVPESVFTDQLFGKWMLLVDRASEAVLPPQKVERALNAVYTNNLIEDTARKFRGWANGMLPNRMPDVESGTHARTCWISAQLNMGSLLGFVGDEEKSLDVFQSLESGLDGNHLAVGEWNKAVNAHHEAALLSEEPGKDTPRFPPYPRYKSSWEYLVRILGLQMDWEFFYFRPFKTLSFSLKNILLAGTRFHIRVEEEWICVRVDGKAERLPLRLRRSESEYTIEFTVRS